MDADSLPRDSFGVSLDLKIAGFVSEESANAFVAIVRILIDKGDLFVVEGNIGVGIVKKVPKSDVLGFRPDGTPILKEDATGITKDGIPIPRLDFNKN